MDAQSLLTFCLLLQHYILKILSIVLRTSSFAIINVMVYNCVFEKTNFMYDSSYFIAAVYNGYQLNLHVHGEDWLCRVVSGFHFFGIFSLEMITNQQTLTRTKTENLRLSIRLKLTNISQYKPQNEVFSFRF